jgi:cell division control protein 45
MSALLYLYSQELNLNLYRHWSLYESLSHTVYTAAKFRIWLNKGKQRLSEFLAELGLPLVIKIYIFKSEQY